MKKHLGLLLSVACITPATQVFAECCECDTVGHTVFVGRQPYQSASAEKIALFRDRMDARKDVDAKGGAMQFTVFGGKSTNESGLRNFFSPVCKSKLTVKEEGFVNEDRAILEKDLPETTDVIGRHFRILTNNGFKRLPINEGDVFEPLFESQICFTPKQTTFGIGLTWRQNLTTLWADNPESKDYSWFMEVSSPLTYIKNKMNLEEKIIEDGGGVYEGLITELGENYQFFGSMKEAFNQSAWKYGKMLGKGCDKSKWRLADIELKLGVEWVKGDTCVLEGYFGVLLPTGNKSTAEYVFEPVVGHNNHWGILKGSSAYFKVWEDEVEGKRLHVTTDLHGMYLFERCEKRSFDLKCKPWSRYMEVYENEEQATEAFNLGADSVAGQLLATPGINVFTQDLKVKPRLSCSLNTAFVYTKDETGFRGEVGYNCYARQKECVKLACAWKEGIALKASQGAGATTSFGEINDRMEYFIDSPNLVTDDPVYIVRKQPTTFDSDFYAAGTIKESDLDLESAAHPAVFSHTFHASLGKRWDDRDYPTYLGVGAAYEYGSDNAAMSRWTLWAKTGFSF